MSNPVSLIVGLGNPGKEYEHTRHNAGFWLVDELARMHGASCSPDKKFQGDTAKIIVGGQTIWLLKPMTFMNRSGHSVAKLAQFYKINPESILVAHDELDFEAGKIRLKQGGGHGGHNGLRDIISQLGNNKNFIRLRIGIGHPGSSDKVTGYVLGKTPASERQLIMQSIDDALRVVPELASGELQRAVNKLHSS